MKPVTHAEKILEYVDKALEVVQRLAPSWLNHKAYLDLVGQIEYLRSVLISPELDRAVLCKMNFGGGGASMESLEKEELGLFKALGGVGWIAEKIASGLKVDLMVLEELMHNLSSCTPRL